MRLMTDIIKKLANDEILPPKNRDHNPPHFHAEYNGNKAIVDINAARVIKGALPSRQLKLILAWCVIHQDELMQNWELAKDMKPLNRINPLI